MFSQTREFGAFLWRLTRGRIALALLIMLIAGVTEGLSLVLLIPLLAAVDPQGAAQAAQIPIIGGWLAGRSISLPVLLAGFVVLIVLQAALVRAKAIYLAKIMHAAIDRVRMMLFHGVGMARWEIIARMRAADINHVLTGEIERIRSAASSLLSVFQAAIMLLIYFGLAALVSWQMALFAVTIGGLLFALLFPIRRRATRFGQQLSGMFQRQNVTVLEFLTGIRVAKSFVVEDDYSERFRGHLDGVREKTVEFARVSTLGSFFFQVASALAAALFVWVAVAYIRLDLPQIAVLLLVFVRLAPRFSGIQDSLQQYFSALPAYVNFRKTIDFYAEHTEPVPPADTEMPKLRRALRFDNVSIRFTGSQAPALHGISLRIAAGRITALIGPSGSGKSTIADLMMGLLQPTSGVILVDDIPLADDNRRLWRKTVAFVPQEPFLLNDTIASNLRIASPDASDEQIWVALESANAANFIRTLPDGLETSVGERGSRFSGGERQRIALARALLREPEFLILDEATSALDWENQQAIAAAIEGLRGRLTILTIAHRPSMIGFADDVIAIEGGRLVEAGHFGQLAAAADSRLAALLRNEAGTR